jgi:myo-inositol-1(or 4)-monophosphatase
MLLKPQLYTIALKAAKTAGALVKKNFNKAKTISSKGGTEVVTNVDIASDKLIKKIIQSKFADHNFITEESDKQNLGSDYTWYIDPIDGTTNFARGIPHFCISIGLEHKGELIIGVIFDPIKNELFTAQKNKGAYLNGKKIKVSTIKTLKNTVLVTGFAYDHFTNPDNNVKQLGDFLKISKGIRRLGSAALDFCYVACGRFDGYWERNLKPWDVAAGILVLQEAGGRVTDYKNKKINLAVVNTIIASNGKIHSQMVKVIKKSYGRG